MNYTREQWAQAVQAAYNAGDVDAANEIAAAADKALGVQQAPQQSDEELFGSMDDGGFDRFAIGVGKGFTDVGRGVQDLYYRATGNEDALSRLNRKAEEEDAMFERDLGDSGLASAGRMVGEIAATAPVGFGIGGAAVKTGMAGRTAMLAATEGAVSEGLIQRGDAATRLRAAAVGGAGGYGGDKLLKFGSNRIGSLLSRKAGKVGAEGMDRVRQAEIDGGYRLDSAQASQDTDALYRANFLARESEDFADFRQGQDADIIDKARGFVRDVGGDPDSMAAKDFRVQAGEALRDGLKTLKDADDTEVSRLYSAWREAAGDSPVPSQGLRESFGEAINDFTVEADDAVGAKVRRVIEKYFGDEADPLTAGNIERVRKEFNAIHRGTASGAAKSEVHGLKDILDNHVETVLGAVDSTGQDAISKGRAATAAFKANREKWSPRDVVTKLAEVGDDGETFRKQPIEALNTVLGLGKTEQLQAVKNRMMLSTDQGVQEGWQRMQQVPLMEALEAAMKTGGSDALSDSFSPKRFRSVLGKYGEKDLRVLWGDEMYGKVNRAMAAWDLKDVASNVEKQGRRQNPSGTSTTMHNMMAGGIRLLVSTPMIGPKLLAVPAFMNAARDMTGKYAAKLDVERMIDGELPLEVERSLRKTAKETFTKDMLGRYDKVIQVAMRAALRDAITGDDYSPEE